MSPQLTSSQEDTHHEQVEHTLTEERQATQEVSDSSHTETHELQHGVNTSVRLPRLDLPTFSGDALEWQPFWDGFDVAVNSNPAISSIQKLNYLRSQLRGEASHVIAGFAHDKCPLWTFRTLLKERYGQPQKLIRAHMQALLDLPNPLNTLEY